MRIIHMSTNNHLEKDKIIKRLTEQMFKNRKELKLTQEKVAELLGKSEKTYQRLESTGCGLSDFFTILNIFQVLQFSTIEIIEVLGLPPLTLSQIKELYQDEDTPKSIQENSICSSISQICAKMDSSTLEKLFCTLMKEYLKRKRFI